MGILRYECEIEYLSDTDRERGGERKSREREGGTVEQIVQKAASANDRA